MQFFPLFKWKIKKKNLRRLLNAQRKQQSDIFPIILSRIIKIKQLPVCTEFIAVTWLNIISSSWYLKTARWKKLARWSSYKRPRTDFCTQLNWFAFNNGWTYHPKTARLLLRPLDRSNRSIRVFGLLKHRDFFCLYLSKQS